MTRDKAYFVGIHRYHYKSGVPAEIVGVEWVMPDTTLTDRAIKNTPNARLCYHIRWADGTEDWVPVIDNATYKIISFQNILKNQIPEITK